MLWDTAGQEEFDAITKAYYRGKTGTGVTLLLWASDPADRHRMFASSGPVLNPIK